MIKSMSPKQRFKLFIFFIFITCMGGTVVEQKNAGAKIPGSSPDRVFLYRRMFNLNMH